MRGLVVPTIVVILASCGPEDAPTPPPARSLRIEPATIRLAPSASTQARAWFKEGDAESDQSAAATWTVDDATLATVSRSGLVTAGASAGATALRASFAGLSASAPVEISTRPPPGQLIIEPGSLSLSEPGSVTLEAFLVTEGGARRAVGSALFGTVWSSDAPSVATVSAYGVVTPIADGRAVVTARHLGATASCEVRVAFAGPAAAVALELGPAHPALRARGATVQLVATERQSDGTRVDRSADASYRSSNSSVASVSAAGLLTALGEGTATIWAELGELGAETAVTVTLEAALPPSAHTIHGVVHDAAGRPLAGARVAADGGSGAVRSGADGHFALPVPVAPRGYRITIEKEGYTYAHRFARALPQQPVSVDPVELVPLDAAVRSIGPAGGTHASSDGEIEIVVPPGALASAVPIRATVLERSRQIPPLPAGTSFTHCVKLDPDLQRFDRPIRIRIKNTLGFAPGDQVPVGIYPRDRGYWSPLTVAFVSADGAWLEYEADHFSYHDINAAAEPSPEASRRDPSELDDLTPAENASSDGHAGAGTKEPCKSWGGNSAISASDGHLEERHALPAHRALGRAVTVELAYSSAGAAPGVLLGFDARARVAPEAHRVELEIAGKRSTAYYAGGLEASRYALRWDGVGPDGAALPTGLYAYRMLHANEHRGSYRVQASFAGMSLYDTGVPGRERVAVALEVEGRAPLLNTQDSPFGAGWGIVGLQQLHPSHLLVTDGDGSMIAFERSGTIHTLAGTGELGSITWPGEGTAATELRVGSVEGLAAGPDGQLYFADPGLRRIVRVDPAGIAASFAGHGRELGVSTGDGRPATRAGFSTLRNGLEVGPDGNVYVGDTSRVRRIDPAGTITTIAGTGEAGAPSPDGTLAIEARLGTLNDIALCPDGDLYVATSTGVRRVRRLGTIETVSRVATSILACGPGGELYAVLPGPRSPEVHLIDRGTGASSRVVGSGRQPAADNGDGGLATLATLGTVRDLAVDRNGELYVSEGGANGRVRHVRSGIIETIAGGGTGGAEGASALEVKLEQAGALAVDSTGTVYVYAGSRVRRVVRTDGATSWTTPGRPGDFSTLSKNSDGTYVRRWSSGLSVHFDASGRMTRREDRNGNAFTYSWDATPTPRLRTIRDPAGQETRFEYDADGKARRIVDPSGRVTELSVDASGDLTRITNPDRSARSFAYQGHRMVEQVDAGGAATRYRYAPGGGVREVERADGTVRGYGSRGTAPTVAELPAGRGSFDSPADRTPAAELFEGFVDATGRRLRVNVNRFGTRTRFEDDEGRTLEITRDSRDLPMGLRSADGHELRFEHDEEGRTTRVEDTAIAAISERRYGAWGQLIHHTDAEGATTQYSYDARGNLTRITDATAKTTDLGYDARGLLISVRDALGGEATIARDALGNVTSVRNPLGEEVGIRYDAHGNVATITDALGRVTRRIHDVMNRPTSMEDASGARTSLAWAPGVGSRTADGGPAWVVEEIAGPGAQRASFGYDALHRPISRAGLDGTEATAARDAEGRITELMALASPTTRSSYDRAGRESSRSYGTETLSFERTADGRVAAIAEGSARVELGYDGAGRPIAMRSLDPTVALDHTVGWTLDRVGQVVRRTSSLVDTIDYEYTRRGELEELTDGTSTVRVRYDERGAPAQITLPGRAVTSYSYDRAGRPVAIDHARGAESLLRLELAWNAAGEPIRITDAAGEHVYAYDALGQITQVTHPRPEPAERYEYDSARAVIATEHGARSVGPDGRPLEDADFRYSYDAAGRRVTATPRSGGAPTTLSYDGRGRLSEVNVGGARVVSYRYDPLDRLIERRDGGTIRRFLYDGADVIAELDDGGARVARYLRAPERAAPYVVERAEGPTSYTVHADHEGSVREVYAIEGPRAASYAYRAHGGERTSAEDFPFPFRFEGLTHDAATGFLDARGLPYDPRAIATAVPAPPPLPGGPNRYNVARPGHELGRTGEDLPGHGGADPPGATRPGSDELGRRTPECDPRIFFRPPRPSPPWPDVLSPVRVEALAVGTGVETARGVDTAALGRDATLEGRELVVPLELEGGAPAWADPDPARPGPYLPSPVH